MRSERSPVRACLTGTLHSAVLARDVLLHPKSTGGTSKVLLIVLSRSEP